MNVNDVIVKDGAVYRILALEDERALCINCSGKTMPKWLPLDKLADCPSTKAPAVDEELTRVQRKKAHVRYTLISPILAFLTDEKARRRMIDRIATSNGISKQTLRRYLYRYLIYQDVNALAPAEAKRNEVLTPDQKNMRWALNKYYYTPKKSRLTDAYIHLLKERYCDTDGKLLPEHPSLRQFRYFEQTYRKQENYLISRNGLKHYQRNNRPLLGEGVQEFAPNLGVGMLDATVCDIYLVNREGQIVGRPILVAAVDSHTSLCMGYSLLWEGGVYSLRQLMLNIISDKIDLCRRMGIVIEHRQWPVNALPGVMITDMGSEYVGETFEQITELGVTIINLPSFRPDLKGPIEKLFDIVQEKYKDALKGKGVIMPDFQERGAHDYRKDARLTIDEFERIVVRCILFYNSERILSDYPYTGAMIRDGVRPYACDIWQHKLSEPGTNLIHVSKQDIVLTLFPRTEGRFTRYGLMANKLRYHRDGYKEAYLKGGKRIVAYNPDDVSSVWLKTDAGYEEFHLIENQYAGQSLVQVKDTQKARDQLVQDEYEAMLQARIDLMNFIESTAQSSEKPAAADIKGIRTARKAEQRKRHNDLGRVLKNG